MSYDESYAITKDKDFYGRLSMCIAEQAKIFVNDGRMQFKQPAYIAINDVSVMADQFLPLVATQPGMTAQATDGDLLAAVQYLWPIVGERFVPPPPPPVPEVLNPPT